MSSAPKTAPETNLDPNLKPKNPKKLVMQISPEGLEYSDYGVFKDFSLIPALYFGPVRKDLIS